MADNIEIGFDIGNVDVSQLETEEEFREAAWALMPHVLRQIGEQMGAVAWDRLQGALKSPGFKMNRSSTDRRRFIEGTAQEFCDQNLGNKEIEDRIVQRLLNAKAGVE